VQELADLQTMIDHAALAALRVALVERAIVDAEIARVSYELRKVERAEGLTG
jgi:hypothetical protein